MYYRVRDHFMQFRFLDGLTAKAAERAQRRAMKKVKRKKSKVKILKRWRQIILGHSTK
jgi:hypothetical protein